MSLRRLSCVGVFVIALPIATSLANAQEIPYQKNLSLKVGESAIIYGVRGWQCGQSAPSWEEIAKQLPTVSTGRFSDGGLGTRQSRGCGGPTPARAIQYTATATGNEQLILFTDPVNIEVK